MAADVPSLRPIAFYLPQFHPIAENDTWWGKGFTEWTNVVKARPLFRGHYQPHLPADLGFYDLRLPEARAAQADLAREYGIHGFCYYHYWFNGTRLLGRPLDDVLASGEPDFPFCLCWANENWTRQWDGLDSSVLMAQRYSEADDVAHLRWLARVFRDPRYIRVDGRPVLLVYRALPIPDRLRTTGLWREEARRLGLGDLYLCRVESFPDEHTDPRDEGFDAAVEFQPDWGHLGPPLRRRRRWRVATRLGLSSPVYQQSQLFEYATVIRNMLGKPAPAYLRYPCVTPSWDNSPRRKIEAVIVRGATPALYETWLSTVVERFRPPSAEENLVFINAWNEWGEGNHLEPCTRWGRAYLEATARVLAGRCSTSTSRSGHAEGERRRTQL